MKGVGADHVRDHEMYLKTTGKIRSADDIFHHRQLLLQHPLQSLVQAMQDRVNQDLGQGLVEQSQVHLLRIEPGEGK